MIGAALEGSATLHEESAPDDLLERFQALYLREFSTVLRVMRTGAGDRDAEDLCADTFCRAWDGWGRFHGDSDLAARAWLLKIARNRLVDHYRRRGRVRLVELDDSTPAAGADHAQRLAVEAALLQLSPPDRELLALRGAGISHDEIAQLTGRSAPAVRKAAERAMDRLRPHLEGVL